MAPTSYRPYFYFMVTVAAVLLPVAAAQPSATASVTAAATLPPLVLCANQVLPSPAAVPIACHNGINKPTDPNGAEPLSGATYPYCVSFGYVCVAQNSDCASEQLGAYIRQYSPASTGLVELLLQFGASTPSSYENIFICNTNGCNDPELDPCADGSDGLPEPSASVTTSASPTPLPFSESATLTLTASASPLSTASSTTSRAPSSATPTPSSAPGLCSGQARPSSAPADLKCYLNANVHDTPTLETQARQGAVYCVAASHLCTEAEAAQHVNPCQDAASGEVVRMYSPGGSDLVDSLVLGTATEDYADVMVCNTDGCNNPASDTCALSDSMITAAFTLAGDMSAAFTNTTRAVADIEAAITVIDTATGATLYEATVTRLRMLSAAAPGSQGVQITYVVPGANAGLFPSLSSALNGQAFLDTMLNYLLQDTGFQNAQVVAPGVAAASEDTPSEAVLGGAIGGALAALLMVALGLACYIRSGKSRKAARALHGSGAAVAPAP